jgi:hypothetical protein
MANPEHLEILKLGVEKWNKWRIRHPDVEPEFTQAELRGAELPGANLAGAKLDWANFGELASETDLGKPYSRRTDLREADLSGAHLNWADLNNADLRGAKLGLAELYGANLSAADLSKADLRDAKLGTANLYRTIMSAADVRRAQLGGAYLSRAELGDANFEAAHVARTVFADIDLSAAQGLDTVKHFGPSTVGIDTIYKSNGKIPEVFLRGCGVPDEFIAYIGSMVGRPIEYYSCFISYSTHDQEFADRLYADLQAKGVRCWFAPHDIKGGRKIHEQIDEAIRLHDRLLLILSEHSMSSEWVNTEIAKARKRETKERKRVLFPVRLVGFERLRDWECFDGDTGKDSAREIREYFIPDFSNWKDHDSYQTAFQRLVTDLKAKASD